MKKTEHRVQMSVALFLVFITISYILYPKPCLYAAGSTPAFDFLLVGQGARATAMGEAVVANCFDYSSLYWNPSGSAFLKRPELGISSKGLYTGAEIRSSYVSFIYPYRKMGFGIQFLGIDTDVTAYESSGKRLADPYKAGNSLTQLIFSYRISDIFSSAIGFGGAAMTVTGNNAAFSSLQATNMNLSGMLKLDRFSAGLAFANFGGDVRSTQSNYEGEKQPSLMRLGASYLLLPDKTLSLNFSLQNVTENKNANRTGIGVEWLPMEFIALRFGLLSYGHAKSLSGAAVGIGINYGGLSFNYSQKSSQVDDVFNVQTVDFSYKFGKAADEPAAEKPPVKKVKEEAPVPVKAPPDAAVPSGKGINLAIADFQAKNVSAADASIVADFLRTELVNNGVYNVIEKANMDRILSEVAFQQSGCTTSECAVQMGKLLNVQRMVVGSLSKLMDTYYITVNLVDVESGKILKSFDQDAMSAKELKNACGILAQKLSK